MSKVYLIVGSVRANRIGRTVTEWVQQQILPAHGLVRELVDLTDWPLPLADEPNVPATGQYTQEHTRRWSQKVGAADGFIFVSLEYNGGYPAALKNSLEHLYKEWTGKPAVIVSYGYHGGDKAAAQLRQVLAGMRACVPHQPIRISRLPKKCTTPRANDPQRNCKVARPETDASLPHIALVGDTYSVLLSGDDYRTELLIMDKK